MKRLLLLIFSLVGFMPTSVWAQQGKSQSKDCQPTVLATQAFEIEAKIEEAAESTAPLADKFALLSKENALEEQMVSCLEQLRKAPVPNQDDAALIFGELRNLSFISNALLKSGFLGNESGGFIPYTQQDPTQIETEVPSCKGIVELVPKIRTFSLAHKDTSTLKVSDLLPFYPNADTMACAFDARKKGYKDVAFEVLFAHLNIETLLGIARSNNNRALVKVLETLPPNSPITISIPQRTSLHCTATTMSLGSGKTTDMNCY